MRQTNPELDKGKKARRWNRRHVAELQGPSVSQYLAQLSSRSSEFIHGRAGSARNPRGLAPCGSRGRSHRSCRPRASPTGLLKVDASMRVLEFAGEAAEPSNAGVSRRICRFRVGGLRPRWSAPSDRAASRARRRRPGLRERAAPAWPCVVAAPGACLRLQAARRRCAGTTYPRHGVMRGNHRLTFAR